MNWQTDQKNWWVLKKIETEKNGTTENIFCSFLNIALIVLILCKIFVWKKKPIMLGFLLLTNILLINLTPVAINKRNSPYNAILLTTLSSGLLFEVVSLLLITLQICFSSFS